MASRTTSESCAEESTKPAEFQPIDLEAMEFGPVGYDFARIHWGSSVNATTATACNTEE